MAKSLTIEQLATRIDKAALLADYYDPDVRQAELLARHDLNQYRLFQLLKYWGKPKLKDTGILTRRTKPKPVKYGHNGCNDNCPGWKRCNKDEATMDFLPCEKALPWEDPELFEKDSRPSLNGNRSWQGTLRA